MLVLLIAKDAWYNAKIIQKNAILHHRLPPDYGVHMLMPSSGTSTEQLGISLAKHSAHKHHKFCSEYDRSEQNSNS